ncbi:MAG: nucleotide-binding protein [Acidobacteria bacterium]|nr:MAG: nucleotide-binding protein [Acidobacteriota bacterium]
MKSKKHANGGDTRAGAVQREPKYVIGIDLGTTNSALAYTAIASEGDASSEVTLMPVPQLVNPGEVRDEPLLPSTLYVPGANDFPAGSLDLPWEQEPRFVVGQLAQKRGTENIGRLVTSAKSWLSHSGVDRTADILPWRAPEGVEKLSPVEASARYLEHLSRAWDSKMPEAPFAQQQILVTVPASFDAVARELTLQAAERAGYRDVTLLEEPQAAFYAWIERHQDWRERVEVGDLILVVDIGGGTTDFTLIAVTEQNGELGLERMAVGEHILLGGDNMDLALARLVTERLAQKGTRIDAFQLQALWHNCRFAKEKLLEPGSTAKEQPVTILGKGTGLVGGTIKAMLGREDLDQILGEGFFPVVASSDLPRRLRRVGLQEIGLPYAADAAVTRHMAQFLRQQAAAGEYERVRRSPSGLAAPTHILFNGGVLRANFVRERIISTIDSWLAEEGFEAVRSLTGEDLMHAVSRGAAYYGLARRGRGIRIRGGVPRTYYVGIESVMPAVPGMAAPLKALTVAPFGMEEGTSIEIPQREFGLVVGEPAEFRFFSSAVRKDDPAGALIEEFGDDLQELSPMQVELPAAVKNGSATVPVSFETVVTETGMLQLWCVARDGRRWKLEFNVRERVAQ